MVLRVYVWLEPWRKNSVGTIQGSETDSERLSKRGWVTTGWVAPIAELYRCGQDRRQYNETDFNMVFRGVINQNIWDNKLQRDKEMFCVYGER